MGIVDNIRNIFSSGSNSNDIFTPEQKEIIMLEVNNLVNELGVDNPPPNDFFKELTEGDFIYSKDTKMEYEPDQYLPLEVVERMLMSGVCMYPFNVKRSQLVQIFRNPTKWRIVSQDKQLADVVRANLIEILPKAADEFTYSAMAYGIAAGELTAKLVTSRELGLDESRGPSKQWLVFDRINFIHPATLKGIRRTKSGDFNGFIQLPTNKDDGKDIVISKDSSIIIPYDDKFKNLWGKSYFTLIYPYWFWFEVILRSMVKYMQRMAAPTVLARAPIGEVIKSPLTNKEVSALAYAFQMAKNIVANGTAALPSTLNREFGKHEWDLQYLETSSSGQNFIDVLEFITQLIFRAGFIAERAVSQSSGGVGSYAIGEIHKNVTETHNELVLLGFMNYINKYWLPKYVMYNKGAKGAPVYIETVGLNTEERELMFKIMNIAGNTTYIESMFSMIDWESLLELQGIPVLPEDLRPKIDLEALLKERNSTKNTNNVAKEEDDERQTTTESGTSSGSGNDPSKGSNDTNSSNKGN